MRGGRHLPATSTVPENLGATLEFEPLRMPLSAWNSANAVVNPAIRSAPLATYQTGTMVSP
jgi:hypothetical protein